MIQIQMWWQKKYMGGDKTNTNVVVVQIQRWWQYKYKCGGNTNTKVVAIQIRGGGDTNTGVVAVQIRGGSFKSSLMLLSSTGLIFTQ